MNMPANSERRPTARATLEYPADDTVPNRFVGVAISGGGSRAANFGAAALEELHKLGILEHVTVISSVSGGSIPAVYYALFGNRLQSDEEWEAMRKIMAEDFLLPLITRYLVPWNLVKTVLTDYDRSDIMASIFDKVLFEGATYSELGQPGPYRPKLLINATDATSGGRRFIFTDELFRNIDSRLDTYPVAYAVMASGAFPGVFNSVTLKDYRRSGSIDHFVHLYDGGPSDNLGLETLLDLARHHYLEAVRRKIPFDGCFIFAVDANATETLSGATFKSDGRAGIIDHIVDRNAFHSISTLLLQRRYDTLVRLGLWQEDNYRNIQRNLHIGRDVFWFDTEISGIRQIFPSISFSEFELFASQEEQRVKASYIKEYAEDVTESMLPSSKCLIWHIKFDRLRSITTYILPDGTPVNIHVGTGATDPLTGQVISPIKTHRADVVTRFRWYLWLVANSLTTNYKLTGIDNCESNFLQQSIYDAAHVLLVEDYDSLEQACAWFSSRGMLQRSYPARSLARVRANLPIEPRPALKTNERTPAANIYELRCRHGSGTAFTSR